MKMAFSRTNLLTPSRGMGCTDHWDGYRLGKSAVTATQFPRMWGTMDDYTAKVNRHLIRLGLQVLNENRRVERVTRDAQTLRVKFVGTWTTLSADDLAEELWACVPDDRINWEGEHEGPRSLRLSPERMERLVTLAASYAREQWRGDWEAENRRRAALGGRRSRRGATYTLEAFLALPEGLTKQQQAEALGCSLGTVDNLRRKAKAAKGTHSVSTPEAVEPEAVEQGMTQQQDMDRPDAFDTFYALFNDWKRDIDKRAEGHVDPVEELSELLDDLLAP